MFGDCDTCNSDVVKEVELHALLHMNARFSKRGCTASERTVLFCARDRSRDPREEKKRERSRVLVSLDFCGGFLCRQVLLMVACFSWNKWHGGCSGLVSAVMRDPGSLAQPWDTRLFCELSAHSIYCRHTLHEDVGRA